MDRWIVGSLDRWIGGSVDVDVDVDALVRG